MSLIMPIFTPELHATFRTEEHRCPSGRIFSNSNSENMQVPPHFEGILYVYFIIAFSLYLHILLIIFNFFLLNSLIKKGHIVVIG